MDAYQGSAVGQVVGQVQVEQIGPGAPLAGRIDMSVECEFGAGLLDGPPDGAVIADC